MLERFFAGAMIVATTLLGLSRHAYGDETNVPPVVSIADLLADKQKWQSRRVEIRGFHQVRVEMSVIYSTSHELLRPYINAKGGLWVNYCGSKPSVKVLKDGYVRIIGTFNFYPGQGCGHMNRWPAEITKLEILEQLHPEQSSDTQSVSNKTNDKYTPVKAPR